MSTGLMSLNTNSYSANSSLNLSPIEMCPGGAASSSSMNSKVVSSPMMPNTASNNNNNVAAASSGSNVNVKKVKRRVNNPYAPYNAATSSTAGSSTANSSMASSASNSAPPTPNANTSFHGFDGTYSASTAAMAAAGNNNNVAQVGSNSNNNNSAMAFMMMQGGSDNNFMLPPAQQQLQQQQEQLSSASAPVHMSFGGGGGYLMMDTNGQSQQQQQQQHMNMMMSLSSPASAATSSSSAATAAAPAPAPQVQGFYAALGNYAAQGGNTTSATAAAAASNPSMVDAMMSNNNYNYSYNNNNNNNNMNSHHQQQQYTSSRNRHHNSNNSNSHAHQMNMMMQQQQQQQQYMMMMQQQQQQMQMQNSGYSTSSSSSSVNSSNAPSPTTMMSYGAGSSSSSSNNAAMMMMMMQGGTGAGAALSNGADAAMTMMQQGGAGAPHHFHSLQSATEQLEQLRGQIAAHSCTAKGRHILTAILRMQQPEHMEALAAEIVPAWGQLIADMNGCHVARTYIECVSGERVAELSAALSRDVVLSMCALSQHSRRVVQAIFETHSPIHLQGIINHVASGAVALATTQQGCISVMRVLEHCTVPQRKQLMAVLAPHLAALAMDPYGNYVVQTVTTALPREEVSATLESSFDGAWVPLACNKFASNVVEKLIRLASAQTRRVLVEEFCCRPEALHVVISDGFGNFVVQALIDSCTSGAEFKKISERVRPLLATSPYGHKIEGKLKSKRFNNMPASSGSDSEQ